MILIVIHIIEERTIANYVATWYAICACVYKYNEDQYLETHIDKRKDWTHLTKTSHYNVCNCRTLLEVEVHKLGDIEI